jgi:hypothetical protein
MPPRLRREQTVSANAARLGYRARKQVASFQTGALVALFQTGAATIVG